MDMFNEKRWYFRQGREQIQRFLGNFSLGALPNHQTLHCPHPPCSYPNIPRNCPSVRTFKTLNQSLVPYIIGIHNKNPQGRTCLPTVVRYWPPSDCLGIIIQVLNLDAMPALIWPPLIPISAHHLHLLSLAQEIKREREPLLIAHSNKQSIHMDQGVMVDANQEVWCGDGL